MKEREREKEIKREERRKDWEGESEGRRGRDGESRGKKKGRYARGGIIIKFIFAVVAAVSPASPPSYSR